MGMEVCKVFVPIGAIGAGIEEKTFWEGMAKRPDIISVDAGSTDSGPFYLGTGVSKYARDAVKSDLRFVLRGAKKASIPVTIGSCGTCGTDGMVDEVCGIVQEIFSEEVEEVIETNN